MDATQITTMISNIGFPIVCVIAMFKLWRDEQDKHEQESQKWIDALNNNTNVMEQLLKRLEDLK